MSDTDSEAKQDRIGMLKSTPELPKVMASYFLKMNFAQMLHKRTAWATAGFPIELLWAYDIYPMHPENSACIAGTKKVSQDMIEYAESMGFSRDLCSYMKTNIGAYEKKIKQEIGGISKPTFVACTGTICDTHVKWFQTQARRMKVPIFVLDVPHFVSGSDADLEKEYIDYLVDQVHDYFDFVKEMTGKKVNEKKFFEVLRKSDRLAELWNNIYDLRKNVPSPVSYADTFRDIFPLVVLPGVDQGIKFYEKLYAEAKEKVAQHKGVVPDEKYRLIFEGIPFWYRMKYFHQMAAKGALIIYEPYTLSFGPRKPLNLNFEDTIRAFAKILLQFPYNYNLESRIKYFEQVINDYKINGVILPRQYELPPLMCGND